MAALFQYINVNVRRSHYVVILALTLIFAQQAQAKLTICNKGEGSVIMAVSHSEGLQSGQFRNIGWVTIKAGDCNTYTDVVKQKRYFYYYAEDEW